MSFPLGLLFAFFAIKLESDIFVVCLALIIVVTVTILHYAIKKRNARFTNFSFNVHKVYEPSTREELEVAGKNAIKSWRLGKERLSRHVTRSNIYAANQKMIDRAWNRQWG